MTIKIVPAASAALILISSLAIAADPVVKCQQAKLKAFGKLQACLKKNEAGVVGGKDNVSASCRTKFTEALDKIDAKATAASAACRILDKADGTVIDLDTGLMWEKKTGADGIANATDRHDVDNLYTWSASPPTPDGTAFTDFLGSLNNGMSGNGAATTGCFAGHCDWRLPTVEELHGIVDMTRAGCDTATAPCIDAAFGPTQYLGLAHWTATSNSDFPNYAYVVDFTNGSNNTNGKPGTSYTRAVRSGQ